MRSTSIRRLDFVADFIGSLNALEPARSTRRRRVRSHAATRTPTRRRARRRRHSDRRLVSVSRCALSACRSARSKSPEPDGGSRLEGTLAEIVYLGMYTQFHVGTRAGRVISSRLADELISPLEVGSRVALSWEPEHTSVLAGSEPLTPL